MRTKQRLLEAACERISAHGYRETTVDEICTRAEANIAAVNYHFGSKEELYSAAWEYAHDIVSRRHPLPDGSCEPREWLEQYVRVRIETVFDNSPGGWFPRLVVHEMMNPTEQVSTFRQKHLRPKIEAARAQIARLLGVSASSFVADTCTLNIHGMLVHLNCMRTFRKGPMGERNFTPEMVQQLVAQMQAFVWGGIQALAGQHDGTTS